MNEAKPKRVTKESKKIEIEVLLPAHMEGHLGDTNILTKVACQVLNEKQNKQKEKGQPYLWYEPVLKEIVE